MNMPAAPATGTPAAPAPGAAAPPAAPPTGAPPAPAGDQTTGFKAPWDGVQGTWTIGEGEAAKPWYEGIQEPEIKEYMKAKNYANPNEAARAAWSANKLINGASDVIGLPPADADQKTMDAFYTKLGRPEGADKYDIKIPEGIETSEGMQKFGKDLAFKLGLNNKQGQTMFDTWNGFAAEMNAATLEQERVANDADLTALTTKWGPELEKMQAAGNRAVKSLGLSNATIEKIEAATGTAAVVELLALLGRKSDEGGFVAGDNKGGDPNDVTNLNKEQAQARIKALQGDAEFQKKYTDKGNPGNKDAIALMERLFAKAN